MFSNFTKFDLISSGPRFNLNPREKKIMQITANNNEYFFFLNK